MLDQDWIASHIPHQGSMCLLDSVHSWDLDKIVCRANSHRSPDNPLLAYGRLGAACAIEYAAQAMAVHGALTASAALAPPKAGYLVSARSVQLLVARLDDVAADLDIEAACLMRGDNNMLYEFKVSEFSVGAEGRLLVNGRAAVILDAAVLASTSGTAL